MNNEIQQFFAEHQGTRDLFYKECATPREVLRESQLPYLPIIGFDIPVKEMFEEAKRLIPLMVSHRSEYEDNAGWKSVVLHGLGAHKTEHADKYGLDPEDDSIYGWTEIAAQAPVTTNFFKNHFRYSAYHRIRFMLLEPGGYVSPHKDFDHYVMGPVNIALNNPEGCDFVMENKGTLPFQQGSILKLALVNRHAVFNGSDQPRIHMIVHGKPDPVFWNPVIWESYKAFTSQPNLISRPAP